MKKIIFAIFCALTMCVLSASTFAQEMLNDGAELLTADEYSKVSSALNKISEAHGMNIVVETTNDFLGDPETDARISYNNSYEGDGVILLISMYDRTWAIWATEGSSRKAMNEEAREEVFARIEDALGRNNFDAAFLGFADGCDEMYTLFENGEPYKKPMNVCFTVILSLVIGLVAALIATGAMRAQLKSVAAQSNANNYVPENGLKITYKRDVFLYKTLTVTHHSESESNSGDDGGSHGHF